ncbi:MAG: hypothetical protein CMO26_04850 [Thiotrichales bacterium]|nr:hypothetical protein [Thiotrichales bacterium]|tara:strand:+ start:205 stop:384 length:180 start_codon:yes stop_codon:yes gene_type:complete
MVESQVSATSPAKRSHTLELGLENLNPQVFENARRSSIGLTEWLDLAIGESPFVDIRIY